MKAGVDKPDLDNGHPDRGHDVRGNGTEDGKILLEVRQAVFFSAASGSGEILCLCPMVIWIFSVFRSPAEQVAVIEPSQVAHRDGERQIWAEGFS